LAGTVPKSGGAVRTPHPPEQGGNAMAWKKPRVVEICLGLEINSYASATL
jgi:coenzyme PQQ precursor peptide PqqA